MIRSLKLPYIVVLCALSISVSAQKLLTNRQIYNFDVGDMFEYQQGLTNGSGNFGPYSHILFTILATRISKGNDTLFYNMKQHYYYRPDSVDIHDITDTVTLSYTQLDSVWQTPTYVSNKKDSFSWTIESFNGRLENKYYYVSPNLLHVEHYTQTEEWGNGIGEILNSQWDDSGPEGSVTELVYYKKKNEVYGSSFFAGFETANDDSHDLNIYPNPLRVGNSLFIDGLSKGTNALKIFDINGKMLYNNDLHGPSQRIDGFNILPGVYTVRLNNENQIFVQKLVVIQ